MFLCWCCCVVLVQLLLNESGILPSLQEDLAHARATLDKGNAPTVSGRIQNLHTLLQLADDVDTELPGFASSNSQPDDDAAYGKYEAGKGSRFTFAPVQLQRFLDFFRFEGDAELNNVPKVRLMTIHASKGKEFDCVIVMNCHEGALPFKFWWQDDSVVDMEQERNCAFVAATRARKWLVVSYASSMQGRHREFGVELSRFLHGFDGFEFF